MGNCEHKNLHVILPSTPPPNQRSKSLPPRTPCVVLPPRTPHVVIDLDRNMNNGISPNWSPGHPKATSKGCGKVEGTKLVISLDRPSPDVVEKEMAILKKHNVRWYPILESLSEEESSTLAGLLLLIKEEDRRSDCFKEQLHHGLEILYCHYNDFGKMTADEYMKRMMAHYVAMLFLLNKEFQFDNGLAAAARPDSEATSPKVLSCSFLLLATSHKSLPSTCVVRPCVAGVQR